MKLRTLVVVIVAAIVLGCCALLQCGETRFMPGWHGGNGGFGSLPTYCAE